MTRPASNAQTRSNIPASNAKRPSSAHLSRECDPKLICTSPGVAILGQIRPIACNLCTFPAALRYNFEIGALL